MDYINSDGVVRDVSAFFKILFLRHWPYLKCSDISALLLVNILFFLRMLYFWVIVLKNCFIWINMTIPFHFKINRNKNCYWIGDSDSGIEVWFWLTFSPNCMYIFNNLKTSSWRYWNQFYPKLPTSCIIILLSFNFYHFKYSENNCNEVRTLWDSQT